MAQIWSTWPGQVLAHHTWSRSKPVCENHQAQFWQNATSLLPVSHFHARLHSSTDGPDLVVQKHPRSDLVCLTVSGFGQTDPVRKQAGVQESLGPLLANASKQIRIRYKLDPACLLGGSSFLLHLHAITGCCYSYMNNTCVPVCFVWLCLPVFILSSNHTGWLGVIIFFTDYHLFLFSFNYCGGFLWGFMSLPGRISPCGLNKVLLNWTELNYMFIAQ